jgi:GDP-L-fucose synthase
MKVLVTGSTGLVGSAIFTKFRSAGHEVVGVNRKIVNLLDQKATESYLAEVRPELVIAAAAKVGGVAANNAYPVDFLIENLEIQNNLMRAAHSANVQKLVFLGSSCIYPKESSQPIKEEYLLSGPLEPTNSAYAMAKIAGIELVKSYRKEFGEQWISLMPSNVYGPNDNFNLASSHVLAAFIRKFTEAVDNGFNIVHLWGTGKPRREFLHSFDLAEGVLLASLNYDSEIPLNIGTGIDLSISELAELVASVTGFRGEIEWDSDKPDGVLRKVLDVTKIKSMGWEPRVTLEEGIASTVDWYRSSLAKGEVRN